MIRDEGTAPSRAEAEVTTPNVAVIFHSRQGTIRALAEAAADGARAGRATVRVLRVLDDTQVRDPGSSREDLARFPLATHADLLWAHGLILAAPTFYGNVSYALKRFMDSTSPLWHEGALADRAITGMTSSTSLHGGREATLLSLYHTMYHWGALIVSAGAGDPALAAAGSNPYGVAAPADQDGVVSEAYLDAAWALGQRLSGVAGRLASSPGASPAVRDPAKIAVVYQSGLGASELAAAIAEGARMHGAEVRLRDVGRTAAQADLEWADAIAVGFAARSGAVGARLMAFLEDCEPLIAAGRLDGKAVTGFVTTARQHGGSESGLLSLYSALHHWGAVIVPPGYTDPSITAAGGNPYGISWTSPEGAAPDRAVLDAALYQGGRLARIAGRLRWSGSRSRDKAHLVPAAHASSPSRPPDGR